jgi:hypothetical protein
MSNRSQKESSQQPYEKVRLLFCVDSVKWYSKEMILSSRRVLCF